MASRRIKREKSSLPVDVRRSKKVLLKLPTEVKQQHCTCITPFFTFLHDYDVKLPKFTLFMEDINKRRRNFLSLSELGYGS